MRKTFAILMMLATLALFASCSDDSSSGPHAITCMSKCLDSNNSEGTCELLCADAEK